jgi:hypothetical protein
MKGRLLVLGTIAVGAVALVGLSAAATMTARNDAREPAKSQPAVKPAQKANAARSAETVTASPKSTRTSADVAGYWTPDRMKSARPMEKTLPGGSPSVSPTPNGGTAPAGTSTKSTPAAQSSTRDAGSEDGAGEFASGPKTSSDPAEYWTQDKMDRAQPMEKTIPGGDGSGGASAPPGGSVGAGIP